MNLKILKLILLLSLFFSFNSIYSEENLSYSKYEILDKKNLYSLSGEWKIKFNSDDRYKLNSFDDSDWESISVPMSWLANNKNELQGWYRVHLFIGDPLRNVDLGFIPPNLLETSEIYFNGILIGKLGVTDENGNILKHNVRPDLFRIDQKLVRYNNDNLISIKLVNYRGGTGGTQNLTYFGSFEVCQNEFHKFLILYFSFAISMIGLGIYHLVIYFKLRNDKVYLYYAGIVFSIASFILFVHRLNYWFSDSFFFFYFLVSFSISFGGISIYLFTSSFFNYNFNRINRTVISFNFLLVFIEVVPFFFPSLFFFRYKYILPIHAFINILFVIVCFYLLIKAGIERKPGWKVISLGSVIFYPIFVWDSLKAINIFPQGKWFLIENGLVIMITFAFAISKKYSDEYEKLLEIEKDYANDLKTEVENKTNYLLTANKELKETNELKNKLFSIISQSLKSPMETLDDILYLHKKRIYSRTELKKYFYSINENLKRNRFLLENLLNWSYSQLEDKGKVEMSQVDLIPILEESILFFRQEIRNKNIEIISDLFKTTYVISNKNILRIIFMNLLSNAIKFSPKNGSILIEVKREKTFIQIEISDSGIGISKDLLENILIKNQLVSTPGTENEKGTGLGLKITRDFVEKINGVFLLETEVNMGTKVKIQLRVE